MKDTLTVYNILYNSIIIKGSSIKDIWSNGVGVGCINVDERTRGGGPA